MHTPRHELTDDELLRYARQIILPEWDVAAQLKLVNSRMVIIGMGGLGCPVAQTLARAGVGRLRLVDFDEIEDSNLQRQNLFTPSDIGKNKAIAAKDALAAHNDFVVYEAVPEKVTVDNISLLIAGASLVMDCTDNFQVRDTINSACVQHKTPFVSAAAIGLEGQLALYDFRQAEQPCYRCVFANDASDGVEDERRCSETGVLASTTQVMGNLAAHVALQFLGLAKNTLPHKLLVWNGMTMQQRTFTYKKDTNCPVCAGV